MPVLKLIGDEWTIEEKIVASIKPGNTFTSQLALMAGKLGTDGWPGHMCLYRTEGKPPGRVRATIPINMNSTPQREKMMDGTFVYVKGADLAQQERDKQFQESLEQFRRDNNIKGLQADGSDIDQFKEWTATHLNVAQYTDVCEAEDHMRARVEVAEFRGFRNITFELRDVQDMKNDEEQQRNDLFNEFSSEMFGWFSSMILEPRSVDERKQACEAETTARALLIEEVDSEREVIVVESLASQRAIDADIEKREREEREREEQRRREEEERLRKEREEEDRKRREEQEAKLREFEMMEAMRKSQERFASPEDIQKIVDQAVDQSNDKIQQIVASEVARVTGGLKSIVEAEMSESKKRYDEMVAYLLPFHNSAVSASFGVQLTHNAQLIELYAEHVKDLGKQVDARVQQTHWALETRKTAEEAAEKEAARLLEEQKKLMNKLEKQTETNAETQDLEEKVLAAQTSRTMDTIYNSILTSRTILDAIALEKQREQLLNDVKIAATHSNYRKLLAERVAAQEARDRSQRLSRLYGTAIPLRTARGRAAAARRRRMTEQIRQGKLQQRKQRQQQQNNNNNNNNANGLVDSDQDGDDDVEGYDSDDVENIENDNDTLSAAPGTSEQDIVNSVAVDLIDVDAQAIMFVFAERHSIPTDDVVQLINKYACPWRVSDELVQRAKVPTSTQFDFARRHVEEHAPILRAVLDLLLDVYKGREVELVAALVTSSHQQNEGKAASHIAAAVTRGEKIDADDLLKKKASASSSSYSFNLNAPENFVEGQEGEGPLLRSFFFHKSLKHSQWLMPRCWEINNNNMNPKESAAADL